MYCLGEEHGVDAPGARPGQHIGQHPQAITLGLLDLAKESAVGLGHTVQPGLAGMVEGAARAGQMPDFLGDAMHVDRKADAAVADKGKAQFLLAHGSV